MTDVWITRSGGRYHRDRDCAGIRDGQAKAASEGYPTHAAEQVSLIRLGRALSPCSVCWPSDPEWDDWRRLEHELLAVGDSRFEHEFLVRVLRHVKGLEPYCVRPQHEVSSTAGRNFRIDFAILPPGGEKIAIEIDGFNKTIAGSVATTRHQDLDSARRSELAIRGWRLLSFTNRQVQTEPGECRRKIENALLGSSESVADHEAPNSPRPATSIGRWEEELTSAATPYVPRAQSSSSGAWKGWVAAIGVGAVVVFWGLGQLNGSSSSADGGMTQPTGSSCPSGFSIKGNVSDSGERIFHEPGWRYYSKTWPEACFADAAAARDAGYRESEVH